MAVVLVCAERSRTFAERQRYAEVEANWGTLIIDGNANRRNKELAKILGDDRYRHVVGIRFVDRLISNEDIAELANLEELTELSLRGQKKIDDGAITHLERMHFLRELDIRYTGITPEGKTRLASAMAKTTIRY
jgi:hypothetical protein